MPFNQGPRSSLLQANIHQKQCSHWAAHSFEAKSAQSARLVGDDHHDTLHLVPGQLCTGLTCGTTGLRECVLGTGAELASWICLTCASSLESEPALQVIPLPCTPELLAPSPGMSKSGDLDESACWVSRSPALWI